MIEAIIFDMDGVLVDTEPIHCKSYMQVLHSHGFPLTETEFYEHWTRKGKGIKEFLEENRLDLDADQLRKEKRRLYQEQLRSSLPIIKCARETVISLSLHYTLALATSSYRYETDIILNASGLKDLFRTTISCEDVQNVKPDPECFLLASQRLNIPPKKVIVVEDAEKGVIAAKKAGMYVIAIPTEHTENHNFSKADLELTCIGQVTPQLIASFN